MKTEVINWKEFKDLHILNKWVTEQCLTRDNIISITYNSHTGEYVVFYWMS